MAVASVPEFELISTSLKEGGVPVQLELVVYKPNGPGPYPLVVFNHGSTGTGRNPRLYRQTVHHPALSEFFMRSGWMTIYPQRRGRGNSNGRYDEGIAKQNRGYSCSVATSLAGVDRAVEDLDAVMEHLSNRQDVMQNQILLAGASRGGALSLAYAGENPQRFLGVVSFNGGWLGRSCTQSYVEVNESVCKRGSRFSGPTLWLHGRSDSYYSIAHCQSNFATFKAHGGQGQFYALPAGHNLISQKRLWEQHLSDFLLTLKPH